jgi:acetylornithine deacetylase/succinyl-diaminopimelate desuccinylase-like protein
MTPADRVRSALDRVMPDARADLERLVRIPSVSADPSASAAMQASAEEVAAQLRSAGLADVEVLHPGGGKPAVVGHRPGPAGAPCVLLYAHHDYGRGAADDKAGVVLHCAALRALRDEELGVGLTVLVEGEEEIASPNLASLLGEHRDRVAADVVVLADSTNWRIGVPALTTSLRGGVNAVVEVRTLRHAVHNGVYGGPVPDALTVLSRLLATLHDDEGDVAVEGLTRGDADPLDLTDEQLRTDAGVLDGVRLLGTGTLTSRLWAGPSISVIGIDAPPVDGAPMTIVPGARAKLTLRVGPGDDANDARDALLRHLERHAPWGATVSVTAGKTVQPFAARTDGPAFAAARQAFAEAWGVPPVEIGVGGSIDFVGAFARELPRAEVLITGVEDPDTRAHGPDESLHLADFAKACLAEALLLARLGGSGLSRAR